MIELVIGIAIGAAFAPFWIKVWNMAKAKYEAFKNKG
jgi:ABC-type anion transport system duplicated permease subunit